MRKDAIVLFLLSNTESGHVSQSTQYTPREASDRQVVANTRDHKHWVL